MVSTFSKTNTYLRLVLVAPYSLLGLIIKNKKKSGKVKEDPPTYKHTLFEEK